MRIQSKWTFAAVTALALATMPAAAQAQDPAKGPLKAPLTQAELAKQNQKLYEQHRREKAELERNARSFPDPWSSKRAKISVKPHEVEMRVEKYVDGAILYSLPVDDKREQRILRGNMYRKVEKLEEVNDRTVFQGRSYRVMRARGTPSEWKSLIGKDVLVKMQSEGGSQVALSARVKR